MKQKKRNYEEERTLKLEFERHITIQSGEKKIIPAEELSQTREFGESPW